MSFCLTILPSPCAAQPFRNFMRSINLQRRAASFARAAFPPARPLTISWNIRSQRSGSTPWSMLRT